MSWNFQEPREVFPWMFLRLTPRDHRNEIIISRGLCAPEATNGPYQEDWHIAASGEFQKEITESKSSSSTTPSASGQRSRASLIRSHVALSRGSSWRAQSRARKYPAFPKLR